MFDVGHGVGIYLTSAVIGLDGRSQSKHGLKRLHSALLHAGVRSLLTGSFVVQPLAASEKNWQPVIIKKKKAEPRHFL